jgi:(p)ppGpp synthase/HD superfamily hydrolase
MSWGRPVRTEELPMSAPTLEDAIALAVEAHRGQRDKAGQTYILHPLRLMLRQHGDTARMVAVLHDVVEDSSYTLERLRELGYPEEVLGALDCLTKREGETYEAFIERIRPHALARRVKLSDLEDNMDVRRLPTLTAKDAERLTRYRAAWARLQEA